jgi:aryl-alcohol dehydrogenase-like predicted oxidoreductase
VVDVQYGQVAGVPGRMARLVLGTAAMTTDRPGEAFALLDRYVELGGNALDTAHIYGVDGSSETVVGQWLASRGGRSDLALIGKGACTTAATPELVSRDLDESLARLGVDHVDVYLMHRDNPQVPAGEFVQAMNDELRAGRVRAIGGSNWLPERIEEANRYAAEHGLVGFAASSPNFSLGSWNEAQWTDCYTASDPATRRWYEDHDLALFAWSSQAGGLFTGRFRPEDRDDPALADLVRVWFNDGNFQRLSRAEELARARGTTSTQIALAYVISQRFTAFALIGPLTVAELDSSMAAADLTLSPAECAYLDLEADSLPVAGPV